MRLANNTMPRVARTESRKPKETERAGCQRRSEVQATQRNVSDLPRSPAVRAASPTTPMTAARRTLGSGPTITTKPARPHAARAPAIGRESRKVRATRMNPPRIRLQFAPLTAVKCVMPVVFMADSRLSGSADASPVTMPGSRPAASAGNHAAASRNCSRAAFAVCRGSKAVLTSTGAVDAERTAVSVWPSLASFRVPVVLKDCPGRTCCQSSPPMTNTISESVTMFPPAVKCSTCAGTVQRPAPVCPGTATAEGGPVTRTLMTTPSPVVAAAASGPCSRTAASTEQCRATAAPIRQARARVADVVLARSLRR